MADMKLKNCPFCASKDIDPTGVASFKKEYRNSNFNWNDNYQPHMIEHKPACNNCGATTDNDWNTRATDSTIEAQETEIKRLRNIIEAMTNDK